MVRQVRAHRAVALELRGGVAVEVRAPGAARIEPDPALVAPDRPEHERVVAASRDLLCQRRVVAAGRACDGERDRRRRRRVERHELDYAGEVVPGESDTGPDRGGLHVPRLDQGAELLRPAGERACAGRLTRAAPRDEVERALPVDSEPAEEWDVDQRRPVEHHRPHRARVPRQVDLRERRAVRDPVEVQCAVADRGADGLEVVRGRRGPVLRRVAVQRRETGSDHDADVLVLLRRRAGQRVRAAGAALIDEDDVVALVHAAPDAVDHGGLLGCADAGTAGEVCEGIRPRRLQPCRHDDDAKPDPRPQTGVAVLGDEQRATLRGHALHDAGTQRQLGLRRRRRGEQDRERAGQHG